MRSHLGGGLALPRRSGAPAKLAAGRFARCESAKCQKMIKTTSEPKISDLSSKYRRRYGEKGDSLRNQRRPGAALLRNAKKLLQSIWMAQGRTKNSRVSQFNNPGLGTSGNIGRRDTQYIQSGESKRIGNLDGKALAGQHVAPPSVGAANKFANRDACL